MADRSLITAERLRELLNYDPETGGSGNTETPTYESLKRKREIADILMQNTLSNPADNWQEGVGGLLQALAYRMMDSKLAPQEADERKRISDLLGGMGAGGPVAGAAGGFTGAGYSGNPQTLAPVSGSPSAPQGGSASLIREKLIGRGLPEHVADGFVMNFQDESGLNPGINEKNPVVPGSRGGFGLAQWTGPRRDGLEAFARNAGKPVSDMDTQLDYLMYELGGSEKAAADKIMATSDPGQAGAAVAQFFLRPAQEHLDRRVAEYTGGQGLAGLTDAMGMGQPDMGRLSELADVIGNPYASEGQKVVAEALIKRMMDGGEGITPYQAAQLGLDQQRLQLERDKFAQGTREGPKFYGNVQWGMRDDPTTPENDPIPTPFQIGSDGSVNWPDLGGAQPMPPTRDIRLGDTVQTVTSAGGKTVGTRDIDVAGEAAKTELGKSSGQAAAGLGERELAVQAAIEQIDRIAGNEALPSVTGMIQGRIPAMTQAGTDLVSEIEGLTSKAFASAIDALRGLGAMTEAEGRAATAALANLDRKKSPEALRAELGRMRQLLLDKLDAARRKAGAAAPSQPGAVAPPPSGDIDSVLERYR